MNRHIGLIRCAIFAAAFACCSSVMAQHDTVAHDGLYVLKDGAAKECIASAKSLPKTANTIVDTRCALVALEVCMNKRSGVISQSQDAKRQCLMMQQLAGPGACLQPCAEAQVLPVGGSASVGRYTNLTEGAKRCYDARMALVSNNAQENACSNNVALQCLENASSLPSVNAAILRERKSACSSYGKKYPAGSCGACSGKELSVDYERLKAADVIPGVN